MALENILNMICFIAIESDVIDQVESSIHDLSTDGMFHCTFLRCSYCTTATTHFYSTRIVFQSLHSTLLHSEYLIFLYGDE